MTVLPEEIERRQFSTVRKGFSPDEVRKFLADVASSYREAQNTPRVRSCRR